MVGVDARWTQCNMRHQQFNRCFFLTSTYLRYVFTRSSLLSLNLIGLGVVTTIPDMDDLLGPAPVPL